MCSSQIAELTSVGLDNESWKALPCAVAQSLLRILLFANIEDRIYSGVPIFPLADGRNLYIKTH